MYDAKELMGQAVERGASDLHLNPGRPPVLRIDKTLERKATERLRALRSRRDPTRVAETLDAVERAAGSDDNLVPRVLDAVEAYATLGEITDRMRNVFGTWSSCLS